MLEAVENVSLPLRHVTFPLGPVSPAYLPGRPQAPLSLPLNYVQVSLSISNSLSLLLSLAEAVGRVALA